VRLGEVAADEAAATVSMKFRTAYNRVGRKIKTRFVIVAAREGSLDATFRLMIKSSTVSAVVHDVEAEIDKLQLVGERHSAVQQVQVMQRKSLDHIPSKFVEVKLDKISSSLPNPLNQSMQVELERCAVFHGVVIAPVDQLFFFDNSGQNWGARFWFLILWLKSHR
jgi:hypothetical protein